jgi:hypothetical protein
MRRARGRGTKGAAAVGQRWPRSFHSNLAAAAAFLSYGGASRTTVGMNHHHRRLLNEIRANVETIAADVDKLEGKSLPFGLRREIQEMIRKLDRLAASYEGEAKNAREIAERLREVETRSSVW